MKKVIFILSICIVALIAYAAYLSSSKTETEVNPTVTTTEPSGGQGTTTVVDSKTPREKTPENELGRRQTKDVIVGLDGQRTDVDVGELQAPTAQKAGGLDGLSVNTTSESNQEAGGLTGLNLND